MATTTIVMESTLFPSITGKIADIQEYLHETGETRRQLTVTGTVKLHGTHADILIHNGNITFQSRNRLELTPENDNLGFAAHMIKQRPAILALAQRYRERYRQLPSASRFASSPSSHGDDPDPTVLIAGEWIGKGVQRRVALEHLPNRMFVIFSICIGGVWQREADYADIDDPASHIYNISRSGFFHGTLDLDDIDASMARLVAISNAVDAECPFAKSFGITGIGEGIVWKFDHAPQESRLWLKTKGPNFMTTRIPIPAAVKMAERQKETDDAEARAADFAERVAHERRLEQGLDHLREMGMERTLKQANEFAMWVLKDVEKEESREMREEEVDVKLVGKHVRKLAFIWYKDELAGKHGD